MAPEPTPVVLVAVLTFRRPLGLAKVLPELVEQAAALSPTARVVVVDNDPGGGAEQSVRAWAGQRVDYLHERRPGIAAGRNRALDAATGADVLAFIDDDEVPGPGWLAALVDTWLRFRCGAVTGPVVPHFESDPEPWVLAAGAFDRRVETTGTAVRGAATNNLLLDMALVRSLNLRFDESYGVTGGEDTRFTHELVARGGRILWCDEAEVIDRLPAERTTRGWVLRRRFRAGTSWSRVELALAAGRTARVRTRLSLTMRGSANLAIATGNAGWGRVRGDLSRRARATCTAAGYAGLVVGAFGFAAAEYTRPP